jgi:hypothetical protein
VRVVPTATTRSLWCRFPGTCEMVGEVFKFVWRLYWKINAICMSLFPFVSFQSRFVTYLLTYPRIVMHSTTNIKICTPCNNKISQLKSPSTFLVSTLTSAISIHPRCPDSDGIIFP